MRTDTPKTIYLKDYKPYPYKIEAIELNFDIHDGYCVVKSVMQVSTPDHCREDMFLNGEHLELMNISLNGEKLANYHKDDTGLTLPCPGLKDFTLEITTRIHPEDNTRLEGLY
ncbi:MAG TPA: aminopeptidase N, partial [Alphaproteobacteria bacterium]|nr:aminopeptidase N [Alphaproteobacteria bacterium]